MAQGGRMLALGAARPVHRRLVGLFILAAAATLGLFPGPALSGIEDPGSPAALSEERLGEALRNAMHQVDLLRQEVERDQVVRKYGEKAGRVVQSLMKSAGPASPQLEAAIDGPLHALFLLQLSTVQQRLTESFLHARNAGAAVNRADKLFVSAAEELVRPESDWSFEPDRQALREELTKALGQESVLAQERSRAAQTERATADVIGKIQKQMEQLGEKMRGSGAGSPWVLWTSYRFPRTPFQLSGRYQDGRANVELNLASSKDPANAEAGFVEGLTPQNLGLSLNVGL